MPPKIFDAPGWYRLGELPPPTWTELNVVPVTFISPAGFRLVTRQVPRDLTWRREIFAVDTRTNPARYRVRYRLQESIHANA